MSAESLSDRDLVQALRSGDHVDGELVDEYYRRCIPIYLDFIGIHWHTGWYLDDGDDIGAGDQVRMIHRIADSIDPGRGQRVLDVGCGIGGTPACLARDYDIEAVGLTPVEEQRRTSAVVIERLGMSGRVAIDLGHAGALPYPDASFDAVMFFESPCHFPDRQEFFDEAIRVLKPGGRLAGEDWLATGTDGHLIDPIRRSWAIPSLATGDEYLEQMAAAGFENRIYVDMRREMPLHKGFAVTAAQQRDLEEEIASCHSPLLGLTLEGLLHLGRAVAAGAFTIGRFSARRPQA